MVQADRKLLPVDIMAVDVADTIYRIAVLTPAAVAELRILQLV